MKSLLAKNIYVVYLVTFAEKVLTLGKSVSYRYALVSEFDVNKSKLHKSLKKLSYNLINIFTYSLQKFTIHLGFRDVYNTLINTGGGVQWV